MQPLQLEMRFANFYVHEVYVGDLVRFKQDMGWDGARENYPVMLITERWLGTETRNDYIRVKAVPSLCGGGTFRATCPAGHVTRVDYMESSTWEL